MYRKKKIFDSCIVMLISKSLSIICFLFNIVDDYKIE